MAEDFFINKMIRDYRTAGFDDEIIAIAEKDMRADKDQKIIDCYMNVKLEKQQRFQLAKALHDGMPIELGEKIITLDKYQIGEVLDRVEERMPYPFIMAVLEKNPSGKHLQFGFEKAKQIVLDRLDDELSEEIVESLTEMAKKETEKNEEPKAEEPKVETPAEEPKEEAPADAKEPEKPKEEPKPKEAAPEPVKVIRPERKKPKKKKRPKPVGGFVELHPQMKPEPEVKAPVADPTPDKSNEEMLEKFGGIFAKSLNDIMTQNNAMMERMINASEERTMMLLDKVMDKATVAPTVEKIVPEVKETEPETPVVKLSKPAEDVKAEPTVKKEAEKVDAPFPETEASKNEETYKRAVSYSEKIKDAVSEREAVIHTPILEAAHKQHVRKMPKEVDGVMRMMYMPDGSIYPVFVEKQMPDKKSGVLGMAGRLFGKESKQNALLSMLIEGRLAPDQIEQIHRAVVLGFGDNDIRDLIYSDLSAEEMKGIVTVIDADKHRNKK